MTLCLVCLTARNELVAMNTVTIKAGPHLEPWHCWTCPTCKTYGERPY